MNKIFGNDTLFARFMNTLADIIWTGLLWLITSIPIITMGAASCAAYQATVRVVRGKTSGVTVVFFDSFKENFSITWLLKILGALFTGWLLFDCIYLYGYGTDFSKTLSFILYIIVAVDIIVISYLYPLISRFDESRWDLFKFSFYLTFRYFPASLAVLIVFIGSLYLCYLMPWSVIVMPGLYWYVVSFPIKWAIGKMAGDKESEEVEEEFNERFNEKVNEDELMSAGKKAGVKYRSEKRNNRTEDNIHRSDTERESLLEKRSTRKDVDDIDEDSKPNTNDLVSKKRDISTDEETDADKRTLFDRIVRKRN